ncbi:MAG TPA: M15 family metallopeptidase [Bacillus bacterium]|nr:M15 family metallopeptidase [Bacillus sp. (in: firmicutes)]
MNKPFIALMLGLLVTGCSNAQALNSNPPDVNAVVPVEEKLIKTETITNGDTMPEGKVDEATDNPDDLLVLVNKQHKLPEDYVPSDLVVPNIPFSFAEDVPKRYVRREAAEALEQLFAAAKVENIELLGASGYRSYARQEAIFAANVQQKGEAEANKVSAVPGESEHQTGLAMDVTSKYVGYDLIEEFAETKEGIWLKNHAHNFGFIIRYPKGKEAITGYSYEPWHIRYVGVDVATEIYQKDFTLEEYFATK